MAQNRTLSVTEARLGLSLLTFLLVALGYVLLQRIGGAGYAPPVEVRPSYAAEHADSSDGTPAGAVTGRELPQVLTAQGTDVSDEQQPYTSRRPEWIRLEADDRSLQPDVAPLR